MARVVSQEELAPPPPPIPASRPVPHRPAVDPLASANQAIERLAMIVTHVAQLPPPQINIPPATAPQAPQARPRSIEANISRDKDGKMNRVVLTPIY